MKIIFIDFSTCLKSVDDLENQARGGMVTSLFKVSDGLAKKGYEVFVLSDIKKGGKTKAGVVWCAKGAGCHLKWYDWDFLVCNRGIGEGYTGIKAKHRILWTHDLPHNGFIQTPKMIKAFSATVFMSRYAERIWKDFYKDIGRSFLIPNGIDKSLFYRGGSKDNKFLIFGSAPNRGLKRLPLIFDAINARVKGPLKMKAYSNMAKMHPNEAAMEHDYALEYETINKSAIKLCDPVPQIMFARQLQIAGLMVLPTDYPEICSNTILQSLACGTPVITTGKLGSACEWVKHKKNGMLTKYQVHDYMVHTLEMVRNAVWVLENNDRHAEMCENAAKTKILSWEDVGEKWGRMFRKLN